MMNCANRVISLVNRKKIATIDTITRNRGPKKPRSQSASPVVLGLSVTSAARCNVVDAAAARSAAKPVRRESISTTPSLSWVLSCLVLASLCTLAGLIATIVARPSVKRVERAADVAYVPGPVISDNGDVVASGEFRGAVPAASVRDQPHHGDLGDAHVLGGSGDRGRHFGVGDLAEPEEVAGECGDLGAR